MNTNEAIEFLENRLSDIAAQPNTPAHIVTGYESVIRHLRSVTDELESLWLLVEEMKCSEIEQHQKVVSDEIEKLLKEKRNIAKVSEA